MVVVGTDANARIASLSPSPSLPSRDSIDSAPPSTRGHDLLSLAADCDLAILNGLDGVPGIHNTFTSFQSKTQGSRSSVIDYFLCKSSLLPCITELRVSSRTEFSDHAHLSLNIAIPSMCLPQKPARLPTEFPSSRRHSTKLPLNSYLDRLLAELLETPCSPKDRLIATYGAFSSSCPPSHTRRVYAYGRIARSQAGAGVFFGPQNASNSSWRVPGQQSDNRASLFAILLALSLTPSSIGLHIFSSSLYAIRSIFDWGPANASLGWHNSAHGDLLRLIACWIRGRTGPVKLSLCKLSNKDGHAAEASRLARAGSILPVPLAPNLMFLQQYPSPPLPPVSPPSFVSFPETPKLSSTVPAVISNEGDTADRHHSRPTRDSHRGRAHARSIKKSILANLVEASTNSGTFWRLYKRLSADRAQKPKVSQCLLDKTTDIAKIRRNLQESEGICRNWRELAGIGGNQQESAGISGNQRESEGIRGNLQEQARTKGNA